MFDIDNFVIQSNSNKIKEKNIIKTNITTPVFKDIENSFFNISISKTRTPKTPKMISLENEETIGKVRAFELFHDNQVNEDIVYKAEDTEYKIDNINCSLVRNLYIIY